MGLGRYATHAVVLLITVCFCGYQSIDRQLPSDLRLGVNGVASRVNETGNVRLTSAGSMVNPVSIPTAAAHPHDVIHYTIGDVQDLTAIAKQFQLSVEQVRWSNPPLLATETIFRGEELLLPPVPGLVATVQSGDTVGSLARKYDVESQTIVDYNYLRDPAHLVVGMPLVVPDGKGPDLAPPIPAGRPPAAHWGRALYSSFNMTIGGAPGPISHPHFPYGQCTWYVATRRPITWSGNAWQWYGAGRKAGLAAGAWPRSGAIMVTWESRVYGHVAYVESVNSDGSWTVSEMNYVGWGVIDRRTIRPGEVPLIGFIY